MMNDSVVKVRLSQQFGERVITLLREPGVRLVEVPHPLKFSADAAFVRFKRLDRLSTTSAELRHN